MVQLSRAVILVSLLAAFGCGPEGKEVSVDLKTDLLPGPEFDRALLYLNEEVVAEVSFSVGEFGATDAVRHGIRIADLEDVSIESHSLRVELQEEGRAVAARELRVEVSEDLALIVVITRDCREAMCPGDGSPQSISCLGGRCVPPECVTGYEESCPPPECFDDSECAGGAACAVPDCDSAVCFLIPDHSRCDVGEYCDPDEGCVPSGALGDGGIVDAGVDSGGDASQDAGLDAPADNPLCGMPCDPGVCATGAYDCSSGEPVCTVETYLVDVECRPSAGPCDAAEMCDGVSAECPVDERLGNETICRESAGVCDVEERCDGGDPGCPVDTYLVDVMCRAGGTCDVAELCAGDSPECPDDAFSPAGSACTGGSCNGSGSCIPSSGCTLGLTDPVVGNLVTSVADGHARCEAQFGAGWVWVDHHFDGAWSVACDWTAGRALGPGERGWAWIRDQNAECHETGALGMTWGHRSTGAGCHGTDSGSCDAYDGDTACTTSLPLICATR